MKFKLIFQMDIFEKKQINLIELEKQIKADVKLLQNLKMV